MSEIKIKRCPSFEKCAAPFCPNNMTGDRWFSDEEICVSQSPAWVKVQRKIAKKTKYPTRYFTIEMLSRGCQIRTGIKGIDPDCRNEEQAIKDWLKTHPTKKAVDPEITAQRCAEMRAHRKRNSEKNRVQ